MSLFSFRKRNHLLEEAARVQTFLDQFGPPTNGERRIARIGDNGEHMYVRNFPLPDGFEPDYIDLMVLLDDYPARPPIGLYVLHKQNAALIRQLSGRFNAFQDSAYHSAPAIRDFTWICYHYANNSWRFREGNPAQGDNTAKFLAGFFAELSK